MSVNQSEHLETIPETEIESKNESSQTEQGVYIPPKIQKSKIRKLFDRLAKYTVFAGLGASSVAVPMAMEQNLPHEEPNPLPTTPKTTPYTGTFESFSDQKTGPSQMTVSLESTNGSLGGSNGGGLEKTSPIKPPIDIVVPEKVSENLHFTPSERIAESPSSVIETTTTETPKKSAI